MKEKNKNILDQLLKQLSAYQPPAGVWEQLENTLSKPAGNGLDTLPQYMPPDEVWARIESGLNPTAGQKPKGSIVKTILPWAAGIAAAITGIVWFFNNGTSLSSSKEGAVTISYSREVVDATLLQRDWEQDEEAFELVNRLCASSAFTCTNPDMLSKQAELDELTEAKQLIEEALGKYGTDADMIGQLAEIERQRTALLKQILDYFI